MSKPKTLTLNEFDNMSTFEWSALLPEIRATIEERDEMRRALNHARDELRRARSSESGRRLLFHTIDPCLTHINEALGDPDEDELP